MANKDKLVALRWDTGEYEKIVNRARRKDMTLSQYIRYMVDKGERCNCDKQGGSW